jgi:hypothetical protein
MRNQAKRGSIKALVTAFGIATVLGLSASATPAFARDWNHGRGHHGHQAHHQRGWDHGRHHRHGNRDRVVVRERYYYAPPRYYAPPAYYAPTPGYYYGGSPNVTFGLSLGF